MKFKEAQLSDEKICLQMIEEFYRIDDYPFNQTRASSNFKELITNDQLGKFWLLIIDQHIAGYLIFTFGYSFEYGGRDAFIDEFFLKKEYRGKGFGTQVLAKLNELAEENDVKAIHLEVESANEIGNNLYRKSGFKGNNRTLLTREVDK